MLLENRANKNQTLLSLLSAAIVFLQGYLLLDLGKKDLLQNLRLETHEIWDCKQGSSVNILGFLGCKSDCRQHHHHLESSDDLGFSKNNMAEFAACSEVERNMKATLDYRLDSTGSI